jgi:hypothetical protein
LLAAPFVRSGKIGKPIALPHHLESLACKPVSVACEPSLWLGLRRAPGNGFRTSETKGAPIGFRTVFASHRDRERAMTPAPNRGKSRVFRGDGGIRG